MADGAYRTIAIAEQIPRPRGLVRANGAQCGCTPPGTLWRWWHAICEGDAWYCNHGFGWQWRARDNDGRDPFQWRQVKS